MTEDPAWRLAQHVCSTDYADLPASAVEAARRDFLDTFGCMLGGSGSPGNRPSHNRRPGIELLVHAMGSFGGHRSLRCSLPAGSARWEV